MLTLEGISEASALRHLAEEAACPALVDGEQLASLGSDLPAGDAGRERERDSGRRSCVALASDPAPCWWLQPLPLP